MAKTDKKQSVGSSSGKKKRAKATSSKKGKSGAAKKKGSKAKSRTKPDISTAEARQKLRKKNLAIIKERAGGLYDILDGYEPISELVVDEDGGADVVFSGKYFYSQKAESYAEKQLAEYWKTPTRITLGLLEPGLFDEFGEPFLENLLRRSTEKGVEFQVGHTSHESFFLFVMGFGLGMHVQELVEKTECKALLIVEPNAEFFHHSLEVFDWTRLLETLAERDGAFEILVNNNPDRINLIIRGWLRSQNPISVDGATCYVHYNNPSFSSALKKLRADQNLILSGLGYFYDETLMIRHTHHNLYAGTERVYNRKEQGLLSPPVFVIGNGPSLDNDLDFLRENQHKAIIVSSGSALRPLLMSGIEPDFQMETENIDVRPLIAQVAEDYDLSSTYLVTSTTVDIDVPPFFDEVLYYFRGSLSPFPIFCDNSDRCLDNPNPTVVNASLSFAIESGFRTIYFFGTDMGTNRGPDKHHSKLAYQYTAGAIHRQQIWNIPVQGNFGGTCMTSEGMHWTRDSAETAIRASQPGRLFYNCSDGVRIDGTIPMPSKLIELPDLPDGKQPIIDSILESFPVFTREDFDARWNDDQLQELLGGWLDKFTDYIKTADFKNPGYLRNLMMILNPPAYGPTGIAEAIPALVFRGSLFQTLICYEYYRRRLTSDQAKTYDKIAMKEFASVIKTLRKRAKEEFGTLSREAAKALAKKSEGTSPA